MNLALLTLLAADVIVGEIPPIKTCDDLAYLPLPPVQMPPVIPAMLLLGPPPPWVPPPLRRAPGTNDYLMRRRAEMRAIVAPRTDDMFGKLPEPPVAITPRIP